MNVYRPPNCSSVSWATEMKHLPDQYRDKKVCVLGDMNEDILENVSQPIHMFVSNDYTQHVFIPYSG